MEQDCIKTQTEVMEKFIQELPRLRKIAGVSQTAFGKRLGLSRQSISSVERGEVPLTWLMYVAAVAYFHESNKIEDLEALNLIKEHRGFIAKHMKD